VLHLGWFGTFLGERMHSKNWLIATIIVLLLSACGGGGGGSNPPAPPVADGGGGDGDTTGDDDGACGVSAQIDFVEGVTESWYLWYDEMASVDKSGFDSAQAYLDARLQPLMDDGRDKGFSYLTTITEDETNISSGAYIGFGWRSDQTGVFIVDVFESGPAFAAGVRRGMELVAVDTGSGFETLDELSDR